MDIVKCAGGIIINPDRQIIVVSQNNTSWSLPKGHVERGENLLQTATREIMEETGLRTIRLIKELGSYSRFSLDKNGFQDEREFKEIHIFYFFTEEYHLSPGDSANPRAIWIGIDHVPKLLTHPLDRKFYLKIRSQLI